MAIARDTFTNGAFANATSRTFAHTCSGTDRFLFVHAFTNVSANRITGVTYNSVSMTLLSSFAIGADRYLYVYYLINPDSGTNNVVISASSTTAIGGNAASYTGVSQTGQPEAFATASTSGSPYSTSVTTLTDDAYTVLFVLSNGVNPIASTGSSFYGGNSVYTDADIFDFAQGTAGSKTMQVTGAGGLQGRIIASIAPAGGGGGYRFVPSLRPFGGL